MLLILLYGIFSMISSISSTINCRVACRRCRENAAYPEMLEVYCAMCGECKERRREWLQGPPKLRFENENHLKNDYLQDNEDDCSTQHTEDPCEEPILLSNKITTAVTTTTTTTTTTTHRPCPSKPHCVRTTTAKAPCFAMPCPVIAPVAVPMCPMCPIAETTTGSSLPVANLPVTNLPHLLSQDGKTMATSSSATESMYFYVGVPKKLLKDLKLIRS